MKKQAGGNGDTKFLVSQMDMGGWIRVYVEQGHPPPDLPVYLSQTVADWFRRKPGLRLKCVVPVCRDGDTVELHAWYESHLFDPTHLGPQATK